MQQTPLREAPEMLWRSVERVWRQLFGDEDAVEVWRSAKRSLASMRSRLDAANTSALAGDLAAGWRDMKHRLTAAHKTEPHGHIDEAVQANALRERLAHAGLLFDTSELPDVQPPSDEEFRAARRRAGTGTPLADLVSEGRR